MHYPVSGYYIWYPLGGPYCSTQNTMCEFSVARDFQDVIIAYAREKQSADKGDMKSALFMAHTCHYGAYWGGKSQTAIVPVNTVAAKMYYKKVITANDPVLSPMATRYLAVLQIAESDEEARLKKAGETRLSAAEAQVILNTLGNTEAKRD